MTEVHLLRIFTNENGDHGGLSKLLLQTAEAYISDRATIYVRSTLNAWQFYEHYGYIYTGDTMSRAGFRIALLEKKT